MAVHVGECAVLVSAPFRKVGEIIDDAPGIGVEDVRPVAVYQNTVFVVLVVCVAPDVGALVEHVDPLSGARQALGYDATGIAGTHDQDVGPHAMPHLLADRLSRNLYSEAQDLCLTNRM